jgi:phosphoesterase RecJ-like protein
MVGDPARRYGFMDDSVMDEIPDDAYRGALAIILDTSARPLISDDRYRLAARTARIDHHIFCETIADVEVTDTRYESCCGLVAELAVESGWKLSPIAAKSLYTGMVTDSGRFLDEGVKGDTMRLAGLMLDQGIDTQRLYAHLYLRDFEDLKFKAQVYSDMKVTENGVAYIHVTREMQERYGLTQENAGNAVSFLSDIRGVLCWLAFIDTPTEEIRVRLRSRFAAINTIAEQYGGGGHAMASGAKVFSAEEMQRLIADADAHIKAYKEEHTDWL